MKVKIEATFPDGKINIFDIEIKDSGNSEVVKIDYIGAKDGGPLMRPSNPPK